MKYVAMASQVTNMSHQRGTEPLPGNNPDSMIIVKGTVITFVGTIVGAGLRFIFEIIAARSVGPDVFGLFFIGFAAFRVASILAEFGLPNGIIRYVSLFDGEGDRGRLKGTIISAIKITAISSLIISFLFLYLSKTLASGFFQNAELTNVLRLFALGIPFTTLTTMLVSSTQGLKKMQYNIFVREIIEPFGRIVLFAVFFLLGVGVYALLFAHLIPVLIGTLLSFYFLSRIFPEITGKNLQPIWETRNLLNFSWPLFFSQFFVFINLWVGTLILGYFRTPEEVGIFSAAQRTSLLLTVVIISFNSIFSPIISDLYNRVEFKKLGYYFKIVNKWMFTFNFFFFLIILFFSKSILNIFGSKFIPGANSLVVLSLGWVISSSTGSTSQVITMSGRTRLNLLNMASVLGMTIVLSLYLIPKFGILGAAIAAAIPIILVNILSLFQVYMIFRMHPFSLDFFKPVIAGCLSFMIIFLFTRYISIGHNISSWFLEIFIFILCYGISLFLMGIDENEKVLLEKIKHRFCSC